MIEQAPSTSYDHVPYPNLSHSRTHPEYLAALATLMGMKPPAVEQCRVLELGCAGGWNLMPMAASLPHSTFVGIDNSARQIEAAQQDSSALKLANLTFRCMDILEIGEDFGQFDYIIAHGVYSWTPPEVRDKILSICKRNLSPQGVAYISYNTYPGWHMLGMVREMLLYHTRGIDDPMQRAAQARTFAQFLAESVPPNEEAYKSFFDFYLQLRSGEFKQVEHLFASILHDELSPINAPVYFYQFAEHAARHGLQYLAETDFPTMILARWPEDVANYIQHSARNPIDVEQYIDFLHNRSHRCTLLCHAEIELDRQLNTEHITGLYVASSAQPIPETTGQPVAQFRGSNKAVFSTNHAITREAMNLLAENAPRALPFETLLSQASARLGTQPAPDDRQMLAGSLLRGFCYSWQLVELHTYQPRLASGISERPLANHTARWQAERQNIVTNLWHERVLLEGLSQPLLLYLDGRHDRAALLNIFTQMAAAGQLGLQEDGALITDAGRIRDSLAYEIDMTLRWMLKTALLMA